MKAKYVHTNIVARDWEKLAAFYEKVFGCRPLKPGRDLSGPDISAATGIPNTHFRGLHLRMPGYDDSGPTLEIFQYYPQGPDGDAIINRPGLAHLAFLVDDVAAAREEVLVNGGRDYGKLVSLPIKGAGTVTLAYLTDPEGNIVEVQSWSKEGA